MISETTIDKPIDDTEYFMESYFVNKCSSKNKINTEHTLSGFINTYDVDGKKVVLTFNQYSNGSDDYDDELVNVEII